MTNKLVRILCVAVWGTGIIMDITAEQSNKTGNTLQLGWGRESIVLAKDKNVPISGQFYLRLSQGEMDPVSVTALAIDDGNDAVIFAALDVVLIRDGLADRVRRAIADRHPEIPADKIILHATHTHASLGTGFQKSAFPEMDAICSTDTILEHLTGWTVAAIEQAWKNRRPGGIAYGYGHATVGFSRRTVYFDDYGKRGQTSGNVTGFFVNGHAVMYGNTDDDQFSHYEAGTESFVNFLYTFDAAGALTGAIANVPCPSQNSGHEWRLSADYWADVREAVKREFGDIFLLPQCAAAGDLSPRQLHYLAAERRRLELKYPKELEKFTHDYVNLRWPGDANAARNLAIERARRLEIAERIAASMREVYEWAKRDRREHAAIRHVRTALPLPRRMVTDAEYRFEQANLSELLKKPFVTEGDFYERANANSMLASQRNRCRTVMARYEAQRKDPDYETVVHVVKLGDIAFATNQFELFMDYMHRIQARSPFVQTFIVQLAGAPGNIGGTYLPTERAVKNLGYSASVYDSIVSPAGGQKLVDETVKILKAIH